MAITIDGVGGRFVEVYDVQSGGMEVGRVSIWEPGRRLGLTWTQAGWPPGAATALEITFDPTAEGGALVRLEHTGFERVPGAIDFIAGYDAGWKDVLGWFAEHAGARTG